MSLTKQEIEQVLATQISKQFLDGMVARMEMSYFKYGDVREVGFGGQGL